MPARCPWCGLESQDHSRCEWCGRDLQQAARAQTSTPGPADDLTEDDIPEFIAPLPVRLEHFLAFILPCAACAMAAAHAATAAAGLAALAASFSAGFSMSVYQLVRSVDDDWALMGFAVLFAIVFHPMLMLVIFGVLVAITGRGEFWTVAGVMGVHQVAMLLVWYAAVPELGPALRLAGWVPVPSLSSVSLLAAVAGWVLANFWRPLNE